MTDRELMQMALDALMRLEQDTFHPAKVFPYKPAIIALRARLAQPEPEELGEVIPADEEQLKRIAKLIEPEPVAWMDSDGFPWTKQGVECRTTPDTYTPLYTAPPQREWQGLTDEEIRYVHKGETFFDFARAIEAKLKEKNT